MIELTLKITSVRIMRSLLSADIIVFDLDGPSPFPKWIPNQKPRLELEVESNCGEQYCRDVFGVEPDEIIEV